MANAPIDFRIFAGAAVPVREFKAGDVIFNQGDTAEELFVIQSGEVEIRLGNRMLEKLSNYNFFGEMALIDSAPRSATAVAVSDVKLVPVGEKQFLFLVSCNDCRGRSKPSWLPTKMRAGRPFTLPRRPICSSDGSWNRHDDLGFSSIYRCLQLHSLLSGGVSSLGF